MATIPGMIGTGDWMTDERPKNWREAMLYQFPNGDMPLTALMSKFSSRTTDDPEFNWWTKALPQQAADVTGVYSDVGLATATTSATHNAPYTMFCKMAAADVVHFRPGHQVVLRDKSDPSNTTNAKVISAVANGASSYIQVKTLQNSVAGAAGSSSPSLYGNNLSHVDYVMVAGSINPEGGSMPSSIVYEPVKYNNYTQIFRTSLEMTRTAAKTKLRTYDQKKEAKREALQMHGIEMERAFIFGVASETVGVNGKPERTTQGIYNWIRANAPENISDYSLDDVRVTTGTSWATGGKAWLNTMFEQLFRYGDSEKLCLCGNGALLGINDLIAASSNVQMNIEPGAKVYGMNIRRWITPFGELALKTHPLFNIDPVMRNAMLIIEPRHIKQVILDDTTFQADKLAGAGGTGQVDGTREEYLSEIGLELHFPNVHGLLLGVGLNNA